MKAKISYSIFSLLLVVLVSSCLNSNDPKNQEFPDNPYFWGLVLQPTPQSPNLGLARFTREYDEVKKDTVIINKDSLAFQTKIDSVTATFHFFSSSKTMLTVDGNERKIKNKDSVRFVDFTKPISVYNVSGNKKKNASYRVKLNVHQVDPDLYQWNEFKKEISTSATKNQKALLFKEQFLFLSLADDGLFSLSKSNDGKNWETKNITNVSKPQLRTLTEHNGELFVSTLEGKLYKSSDASVWSELNFTKLQMKNLLFSFKGELWAIALKDDNKYSFVKSTDGSLWENVGYLPDGFPLVDYSALVFKTAVGNPKVILLGGYDKDGKLSKTRWSTINPLRPWVNLPIVKSDSLSTAENAAIVEYDNRLVLFGGKDKKDQLVGLLESYDEGLTWRKPKVDQMSLPEDWEERSQSTAFLSKDENRIYVVGGVKGTRIFSDFWSVQLNKISFKNYKKNKRK